ncbi:M48 family metallopeptidase [Oceanirhabdus seepicola]|uniref:M48 family metallopeptidase n=1 Tax=Oceanirhabdus seepicola TaxID=2828781 RepID=A0A9J6NXP6_9CLOT|nr:M48 family metallopeptidase [Oceanirhabdus seepicola]MCM1988766.1 M48 family metallopeptidase [Oceanirhabdus seepicola]
MESYKSISKNLIHPWEKKMRAMNIVIFIIIVTSIVGIGFYALINIDSIDEEIIQVAAGAFVVIPIVIFGMGKQYAKSRATSIQITEKQFPEVYQVIKNFSDKLEMGYVPEAYVVQAGGVINAFATAFFSRKYISINSDIFELCYLEHKDLDTLAFVIGHELTHLKRKHATMGMVIVEIFASMIPIWGSTQSRVKEYTCDRHAAWLCPEGVDGLIVLSAGKHLYKQVNIDEYLETSKNCKGIFCWVHNLTASHPIMPKRIKAIQNLDKPGEVL